MNKKNIQKHFRIILVYLLFVLSIGIFRLVEWAKISFSDLTLEQIIFHIKVPLDGADTTLVSSGIKYVIIPVFILFLLIISIYSIYVYIDSVERYQYYLHFKLLGFSKYSREFKFPILPDKFFKSIAIIGTMFFLIAAYISADNNFHVSAFVKSQNEQSTFIEDNYIDPLTNVIFPEQKRNLIYIYLESMESTYTSKEFGGAFDENYIAELTDLALENISFSHSNVLGGFKQGVGSGWTIGAMFAQSTGLPLTIPINGNSMSEYSEFFPGVVSLGDVLLKHGYSNHLLIGSDAEFGGRRKFYEQHGDYNIYDYNYAVENGLIPEDYFVFWGYEDHKLFEIAKKKLLEIKDSSEPFNFTILTVDTHFEDGFVCELCEDEFSEQYANVISCSSKLVNEFVKWIQAQDFYENTSIVLVGDHRTMDRNFLDGIDSGFHRTIYNAFINSGFDKSEIKEKYREFNTYDIFPTILATLNVDILDNKLGLGTNMFSNEKTLLEKYGPDINIELSKSSSFYRKKFIYGH